MVDYGGGSSGLIDDAWWRRYGIGLCHGLCGRGCGLRVNHLEIDVVIVGLVS